MTRDFDKRLKFHYESTSHKFTSRTKDWELFFIEQCESKKQALAIEKHIKKMKSKIYIKNLKTYPAIITKLKAKYRAL